MDEEIRLLDISNFDELKELIITCADWLSSQGFHHWSEYYSKDRIKEKLLKTQVYGLFIDQKLICSVSLSNIPPNYYEKKDFKFFKIKDSNPTYLSMLAVYPKFHKKGIASKMLKFSEEISKKNSNAIRIDVLKVLKELNNFYEKRRFSIVKEISKRDVEMNYYEKKLNKY